MVAFSFRTQGFDVGYGGEGVFAFGETRDHAWHGHGYPDTWPAMRQDVLMWRIDVSAKPQWEQYAWSLVPEEVTPRREKLQAFWAELGLPVGRMQRSRSDEFPGVALTYSLSNDPALSVFLLSALSAGRELSIYCPGFRFIDEDCLAPAPSMKGFDERFEPAFVSDPPILRLA